MNRRKHQVEAYFQQGRQLHSAGRLAEAEQVYRQVLTAAPRHAESLHMLGVIAVQRGELGAALTFFDQAIALKPNAAIYHVNRATVLLGFGRAADAAEASRTALRHNCKSAEALQTLGHALCDLGRPAEAITTYQDALSQNPALPDLQNNLGLALRQAGRLEDAAQVLRDAVIRTPQDEQALSNLAGVLGELDQQQEAEGTYRSALRLRPDSPMLHFNLAVLLLRTGRFTEGWQENEWRFRAGVAKLPPCERPRWDGAPLAGRTLLVRAEQGFGDFFQFCRYVPLITGGQVILEVYPNLVRVTQGLSGVAMTVSRGDPLPPFDLYVPLLSLPSLFSPPSALPYLNAEPALVTEWRSRLGTEGYKIGIAWQGNPESLAEFGRSVPLRHFAPLAALAGVRLISLQRHHGLEQLASVPFASRIETPELDTGADGFVDTAAVMETLDLVITSDTAIAHLAGALGRPVWVALKQIPDWRWLMHRPDSPWYPSMRLFRQTSRGDWDGVFATITQELQRLLA